MGEFNSFVYLKSVFERWGRTTIEFIPNIFMVFVVLIVAKFCTLFIQKF